MTFRLPTVMSGITQSVTHIGNAVTGRNNDAKYFNTSKKGEIQELKAELHSKSKEKKKEAIKKVIAAMTIGKDVSGLFPDVVNCLQTSNIELKRLVYLYIINYAKIQPELAILAINTFRKDCLDSNPLIRALAVRTIGCIQLKQMEEYLVEPLRRACKDGDPYVRKTAATCICKLYDTSPKTVEQDFLSILREMLNDANSSVVTNALASLTEISETSGKDVLALNESIVTKLLTVLNDSSEWGQVFTLDALARYTPENEKFAKECVGKVLARLSHSNPAVVLSSVRVIFRYLSAVKDTHFILSTHRILAPPLISLLSSEPEVQYVVLRNISFIIHKHPKLLMNDVKPFYCKYNDPPYVKLEKIEIMVSSASEDNVEQILQEFSEYVCEVDVEFVRRTIRAIGRCAIKLQKSADRCIQTLLSMMESGVNHAFQEIFVVMKDILRCYPERYQVVLPFLCNYIQLLDEPESKASMVWMIGEYAQHIHNAVELLEFFIDGFEDDSSTICQQVLTSSVKLFLKKPTEAQDLVTRVLKLCTDKTNDPDLRDRGFIYWRLLSISPESAKSIVLQPCCPIDYKTLSTDPVLLNVLMDQIATMASVFHRSPSYFFMRSHHQLNKLEECETNRKFFLSTAKTYSDIITGDQISESHTSPKHVLSAQNASSMSETASSSCTGLDLLDSPDGASDTLEETMEVLSLNSQGCHGESGLVIHAVIRRDQCQDDVILELHVRNERPSGILYGKDWAIQVNKNVFGFTPKNPTNLGFDDISPGARAETEVVLVPNVNVLAPTTSVPLVLQVAVKTSLDIFYLKPIPFSPSILFTRTLRTNISDMNIFNSLWDTLTSSQRTSFTATSRTMLEPQSLIEKLRENLQFTVVAVQDFDDNTSAYFHGGTVNQWLILSHIVLEKTQPNIRFELRCDSQSIFPLLQNFILSLLN